MRRTMDDLIDELKNKPEHIMFLYRWLRETKYTWEEREKLCEYLIENIDDLKTHIRKVAYAGEDTVPRGWAYLEHRKKERNGYVQKGSDKNHNEDGEYLRGEDHLAMDIFLFGRDKKGDCPEYINGLGYVLDYQMPIGGTPTLLLVNNDSIYDKTNPDYVYGIPDPDKADKDDPKERLFKPGKCDLIAFDDGHIIIYELKKEKNKESMLRAVMEAYTYLHMIDQEQATDSLRTNYKGLIPAGKVLWEARVLLYKNKAQYKEYMKKEDSNLRKLMQKLKVIPVWYTTGFSFEE